MRKYISQREAMRLQKRVLELATIITQSRMAWVRDYPGGTRIATEIDVSLTTMSAIQTARKLGYPVVAVDNGNELLMYAVKPMEKPR